MTILSKEQVDELENIECPMDDVGFEPETIDGKGEDQEKKEDTAEE